MEGGAFPVWCGIVGLLPAHHRGFGMRQRPWILGATCLLAAACGDDSSGTGGAAGSGGATSTATTSSTSVGPGSSSSESSSGSGEGGSGDGGSGTGANGTGGNGTGGDTSTGGHGTGGAPGTGGGGTGGGGDPQRLFVPGGDFLRQNDEGLPATVSDYYLDRDELTVARFRAYYASLDSAAQSALSLRFAACDDATWTDAPGDNEQLPINCIARAEGAPACAAVGGRLPTELEWNYAAAGGDEQRVFPWSDPPDSIVLDATRAVYNDSGDSSIQPVGSRPDGAGRWGHLDLAGNVWEMIADSDNNAYVSDAVCDDCRYMELPSEPRYVRRGGNIDSHDDRLRNDSRDGDSDDQDSDIGVRCAYDSP